MRVGHSFSSASKTHANGAPTFHRSEYFKRPLKESQHSVPGVPGGDLVVHGHPIVEEGMRGVGINAHLEVFLVCDHGFYQFIEMRVDTHILRSVVAEYGTGDVLD